MNTEDTPTVPGVRPCIRRALNRTFDDMAFDTPVNATMYVGVRKSVLKAHRREITFNIWFCAVIAFIGLTVVTLAL